MKITIIDHVGLVPVLAALPEWATSDDTFNFDRQVFEENPTWKWFIRYAAPCEVAVLVSGCEPNREFCFLVHKAFPGCRNKSLYSRPLGRPLDHFDAEHVQVAQGELIQHANMLRGSMPPGAGGSQNIRATYKRGR
jgi:hypothetical protein